MNKKAIILARVSTEQQSLESQLDRLKEETRRYGYKDEDVVIVSGKESGLKQDIEERETLLELHRHIETEQYDMVFIWEVSRLSRQPAILFEEVDYLISHNVNLHCITPQFTMLKDDGTIDATAELVLSIFGTIAKEEARMTKERMKRGRKNKVMQNKYVGGTVLFGYKVNKENNAIERDEQDKKTVIEIFERYLNNESIRSIAIDLMDRGLIRYSNYESARCMLADMIKKCEYVGIRGTNYEYPPIITKAMFDAAQKRKKKIRTNNTNIYYCKGLIHWKKNDHILSPMLGQLSYGTHYGFSKDELMLVNMNLMDSLILHTVINHRNKMKGTIKKKTINEILDRMNANNQKMQKITADIEEIKDIIDRINERIVKGRILEEKGDKMIDDEQKRYALLVKTMRTISDENKELDKQLEKIMHGNELEYDKIDDTQKYNIIHDDIERIEIDKDNIEKGGKYIEVMFKDTTIYKYHLTKYGNYDRIYIIDNDKETRLEGFNVIRRFGRKC